MYTTADPLQNVNACKPGQTVSHQRVYQVWKGSNRFFLGGRLIFGPDVRSLVATLFLILAPVICFCIFVGRHLMKDYSGGIAIVVVTVLLTCGILVLLLKTSGGDPGIVPRNKRPPESEGEPSSSTEWSGGQTPRSRLPRTKDVVVNGVTVKVKYCDTCMLYRPPRCSHCSICNNCVERFDHHCPWVGQCIGRCNYPYFFMFVCSTTILCFFIIAMCALRIKKLMEGDPPHTVWKALQRSPACAFLMAYAFLATWFVGGLTVFHLYLISTNQTTFENFRYRYDNRTNPYNQGFLHNFIEVLCSRTPPSKNNFRARVQQQEDSACVCVSSQRQENADVFSPNNMKAGGEAGMGTKSIWMPSVGNEESQNIQGRNNQHTLRTVKYGYGDEFSGDFGTNCELGDVRSVPRHSSGNRKSLNWEIAPELLTVSSGVSSEGFKLAHNVPASLMQNR